MFFPAQPGNIWFTIQQQNFVLLEAQPTVSRDDDGSRSLNKSAEASSSAFAETAFGKLAKGSSPFAALGASESPAFSSLAKSTQPSPLSPKTSTASRPETAAAAPKLTVGNNDFVSPFAGLSPGNNGFASKGGSGGGFASAFSVTKPLTTFAAAGGKLTQGGRAAKPFGAPDSDSDDSDDLAGEQAEADVQAEEPLRAASPDKETDDKRRTKLQKGSPPSPPFLSTLSLNGPDAMLTPPHLQWK